MRVHESRSSVPQGFVNQGPAAPDTVLHMRIALTQSDSAGLEDALMAVSTPGSASFGQHLSKEEVEAFVSPSQDTTDAVRTFLEQSGIQATEITPAGDWLGFQLTVGEANQLFESNFNVFKHAESGRENIVTMAYSVPADLSEHVRLVHPTISFNSAFPKLPLITTPLVNPISQASSSSDVTPPASCTNVTTPACLQNLYNIPTAAAKSSSNNLGVAGFIEEFANKQDLSLFLKTLRPDINPATTFHLETLDNGTNSQVLADAGFEASLDIQYTVGIATGVPVTFISAGEQNFDSDLDGFLDMIRFLQFQISPPQVLTTSYGQDEDEVSPALAESLCNAYAQLGARGVSILFSSGDGGVGGGGQGLECTTFEPAFPSGCPFMTSVGATTDIPETSAFFSSGGFSNVFARPAYQAQAVAAYLKRLGTTNAGLFNTTGRAFPDVAAQGTDFEVFVGQQPFLISGTSCSSPLFAAMVSLVNAELLSAGKRPLGFLNPFLYGAAAGAFSDITTGSNPGCGTNGFPALEGWDPVTGLGTPNFSALLAAAKKAAGL